MLPSGNNNMLDTLDILNNVPCMQVLKVGMNGRDIPNAFITAERARLYLCGQRSGNLKELRIMNLIQYIVPMSTISYS